MDNTTPTINERTSNKNVNGSVRRPLPVHGGSSPSGAATVATGVSGRPHTLDSSPTNAPAASPSGRTQIVTVIVMKDEKGYGMKVSGDYPVYVQSVKPGGAAEKAGLRRDDKIIKVNGINVMHSTHYDVVELIKKLNQVVLTVQQRAGAHKEMGSPSFVQASRPLTTPASQRITGPQPVDHEKQYQLQLEREQQIRLMIEKEQRFIDQLRSEIAIAPNEKKAEKLLKAESNLQKLQSILHPQVKAQNEQSPSTTHSFSKLDDTPPPLPKSPPPHLLNRSFTTHPPKLHKMSQSLPTQSPDFAASDNNDCGDAPPPLPKRNSRPLDTSPLNNKRTSYVNSKAMSKSLNSKIPRKSSSKMVKSISDPSDGHMVENLLYSVDPSVPPPLPPRAPVSDPSGTQDADAANSLSKQMLYPLVATCTPLINNCSSNHTHHRTKSSPDSLCMLSPAEASKRLIASESMDNLSRSEGWESAPTPPGTPPPPYPSPLNSRKQFCSGSNRSSANTDDGDVPFEETTVDVSSTDASPQRTVATSPGNMGRVIANSSPIHAATPQTTQQPIISMEDDEISDPEVGHLEDHGPFKSLSRLWEHTPHLAVFMNYVLSNSDPSSLLFYLITDLYKEGNAKEMRKWAFEIHSSFLVPGAPLRLSNVDENIAREIDENLSNEFDKEEILRKIFWKARNRAKEELTRQLADFQQKRTAGLGTIFGPSDAALGEIIQDKAKEMKLYESILLDKLEPYLDEIDRENYDPRRYLMVAALATVVTRIFGIRPPGHALDRCPTFVNKEKSFRTKFIGKYSRKFNHQGHPFVAQQYYTVIVCNHCHQIIYGIGPQGYQCSACLINVHRLCMKLYEDICPGPFNKKNRGIEKLMDRIRPESRDHRRKQTYQFIQAEKERRSAEEKDSGVDLDASGETKPGQPVSRSSSDRRPDSVREESSKSGSEHQNHNDHDVENANIDSTVSLPTYTGNKKKSSTNINRSESVKEQSEKRKQRRNISDPLHNTSKETDDLDQQGLPYHAHSGSSSNSSLSSNKSSESPSTSLDAVSRFPDSHPAGTGWDSDMELEADPPDWQSSVPEDELAGLHPYEKKRQDVINEIFHTERSHVRNLRVLEHVFCKPLHSSKILKQDELNLIFANLSELLDLHLQFNAGMKNKRKEGSIVGECGDLLLNMFDGTTGENFQRAAATFCERQQLALEFIKERRKKDSRFDNFLCECEKNNLCRRLPLQGILPTEMQRLSKYPLLLERLIDSEEKLKDTESGYTQAELNKLRQAHDRSKEILNHVNEAAKVAFNRHRLEDLQRHLDTSMFEKTDHAIVNEFKNLDLTKYKLIHEGPMHLRRPNKQPLAVHVVLLEEAVILLQKDAERYVLKFFQAGTPNQQYLAPVMKTSSLIVRTNAASKSSLFVVNTSTHSQMYDLVAKDSVERDIWFKHISDAAEAYNKREGKSKRSEPTPDADESETVQDLPSTKDVSERAEQVCAGEPLNGLATPESSPEASAGRLSEEDKEKGQSDNEGVTNTDTPVINGAAVKLRAEDWPLVQPTEIHVAAPPVLTAEPVLTPIEQIRRKDEEVKKALQEKEALVADLLCIPRESYSVIADMASEEAHKNTSDPSELVLAAVYQAGQLLSTINDSLNITDADVILARGGKHPSCASNESLVAEHKQPPVPSMPVVKVQEIATTLSSQLTTLLSVVKQREEERDRLRKELQRTREQLHEKCSLHGPTLIEQNSITEEENVQAGDLERIEESPSENITD